MNDIEMQPKGNQDFAAASLTITEAAKMLNVSYNTVRTALLNGNIPYYQIGGARRILKSEIMKIINKGKTPCEDRRQIPTGYGNTATAPTMSSGPSRLARDAFLRGQQIAARQNASSGNSSQA